MLDSVVWISHMKAALNFQFHKIIFIVDKDHKKILHQENNGSFKNGPLK